MTDRKKAFRVEILKDCEVSLTGGVTGSFRRFEKGWTGPVAEKCFNSLMAQDGAARDLGEDREKPTVDDTVQRAASKGSGGAPRSKPTSLA
jgi:hypothetical protein